MVLPPAGIDLALCSGSSFGLSEVFLWYVESFIPDVIGYGPKVAMITGQLILYPVSSSYEHLTASSLHIKEIIIMRKIRILNSFLLVAIAAVCVAIVIQIS